VNSSLTAFSAPLLSWPIGGGQLSVALSMSVEDELGVSLGLIQKGGERIVSPAYGERERLARHEKAPREEKIHEPREVLHLLRIEGERSDQPCESLTGVNLVVGN
jgi:hypothetical protein